MKAVVLVGRRSTRPSPAHPLGAEADAADRGCAMIERVSPSLAKHGVDEAILSPATCPTSFAEAYRRAARRVSASSTPSSPSPSIRPARCACCELRRIDETFLVVNGDVLTDLDVSALIAFHRDKQRRGNDRAPPGAGPLGVRVVVPTDAEGRVTAFVENRRARGPDQRDQCRHLCARTLGPQAHPGVGPGVDRARDSFPPWCAMAVSSPLRRRLLGSTPDARRLPAGQPGHLEGKRLASSLPGAHLVSGEILGERRAGARRAALWRLWIGEGAVIAETAVVERSVIGPGSVVEAGANGHGLDPPRGSGWPRSRRSENSILGPGSRRIGERCTVTGSRCSATGHGGLGQPDRRGEDPG